MTERVEASSLRRVLSWMSDETPEQQVAGCPIHLGRSLPATTLPAWHGMAGRGSANG